MTDTPTGVDAAVRQYAAHMPHALAVLSDQGVLTWAEFDRRADYLANGLRCAGIAPGDYIAWLGRNRIEFPILIVAARRARAVIVGLNWRLKPAELAAIVADCAPKLIITESELAPLLGEGALDRKLVFLEGGAERRSFAQLMASGRDPLPHLTPKPDDPVFLYYTSGTTAKPKGVLHGLARTDAAVSAETPFGWGQDSINLIVAPVFHLTGSVWTQSSLVIGAAQVQSASTSAALILAAIDRWRVTHTVLVPTMIAIVLNELQKKDSVKIDSLKMVTYGGAPMTQPLLREALERLHCRFAQGYGLTETNCPATFLNPDDHVLEGPRARLLGSVGRGYAGIRIRIADPATGKILGPGQVGEVQIHTPWRMLGYRNEPALTAAVLDESGWFRSGDGGHLDEEGYLYLGDRINDMIITGGENVMPSEVEAVLAQHAAIAEAAVFGVSDPVWGESVCAAVVRRPGQEVSKDEIIHFSRERLAHYKCPKELIVIDELPRGATGKVLRRELRVRFKTADQRTP